MFPDVDIRIKAEGICRVKSAKNGQKSIHNKSKGLFSTDFGGLAKMICAKDPHILP